MTKQLLKTGILCSAVLVSAIAGISAAQAKGKEFFSEDYHFNQAMHGFEGQQGNYYCSYQRLPNRVCSVDANGNERCQIKGWTLRQYCY